MTFTEQVRAVLSEIEAMLLEKNRAYGNSALEPVRIFSKADSIEQLKVRLDDKLSRLMRGEAAGEDVELDLVGYLVLLRVARQMVSRQSSVVSSPMLNRDTHNFVFADPVGVIECTRCGLRHDAAKSMSEAEIEKALCVPCVPKPRERVKAEVRRAPTPPDADDWREVIAGTSEH